MVSVPGSRSVETNVPESVRVPAMAFSTLALTTAASAGWTIGGTLTFSERRASIATKARATTAATATGPKGPAEPGAPHRPGDALSREKPVQLRVELRPMLRRVQLPQRGPELLVVVRLHPVVPRAIRRVARARFKREATVPSGIPSTRALSR